MMVNVMANLKITFQRDDKMSTMKLKSHLNLTQYTGIHFFDFSPLFFLRVIFIYSSLLSDSMPFEKVVSDFSPVDCSWSAPSEFDSIVSNIEAGRYITVTRYRCTFVTDTGCCNCFNRLFVHCFCVQFFLVS